MRKFARNAKNPYQDYSIDKPNRVKIKAENVKYGNAILGYQKFNDMPWRFGHDVEKLNPDTIIEIAGVGSHTLPTAKVIEYLDLHDIDLRVIESDGFGFPTKSYVVPISPLVQYCNGSKAFAS